MKKFLFHLTLIIVGIAIIDICIGFISKSAIHKNQGLGYNLNYMECDVAIIGGSTAYCHYNPSLLRDSLFVKTGQEFDCYNSGSAYQEIPYCWCVFKGLADRCHPQLVIIDIQPQQLSGKVFSQAIQNLQPFFEVNNYVKRVCNDNTDWNWKVKNSINMVKYNTIFLNCLINLFWPKPVSLRSDNDGFIITKGIVEDYSFSPEKDSSDINETFESYMKDIIATASEKDIKIVFCMSPRLKYVDKQSASYLKILSICESSQIPLLDYSNDLRFRDGQLFYDVLHLNEEGAFLYSQLIAHDINQLLQ